MQINTEARGYSPPEAEQRITFPLETAFAGVAEARLHALAFALRPVAGDGRLQGRHGHLSSRCQQAFCVASRRLKSPVLPRGRRTWGAGPIATGMGEIFMYTVTAVLDARRPTERAGRRRPANAELDWPQGLQLRSVPGVTEVNTDRWILPARFQVALPYPAQTAGWAGSRSMT